MSSQCPVREGVGIDNAPLREGAGIVGRADTRPDTAPQPLPTQAVDPDLCLPAKKTAPAPPDNATPQTTPPPPAPVTVSVEDMSARLADTAPGQTVVVFVGKGQSLGLVGGVAYQHPIAVTAFPASSVTALLAASHDQSAAGAAAGADGALVTAGDLAEGFPALQIAVDPADRCALAHATKTDSDGLSESVLLERPDHRRGSSGGVSVPRKGLRRSADGFVNSWRLFFLPPSPCPSLAFIHPDNRLGLARPSQRKPEHTESYLRSVSSPPERSPQTRARQRAHHTPPPPRRSQVQAARHRPGPDRLPPPPPPRAARGTGGGGGGVLPAEPPLQRPRGGVRLPGGGLLPRGHVPHEPQRHRRGGQRRHLDRAGARARGVRAMATEEGGVVERREGGGVYRLGKRTRASNLLRVRSPQRPREMGARRKGAPRSWGREPWSGVADHRAAAGAWPGPMITVH